MQNPGAVVVPVACDCEFKVLRERMLQISGETSEGPEILAAISRKVRFYEQK